MNLTSFEFNEPNISGTVVVYKNGSINHPGYILRAGSPLEPLVGNFKLGRTLLRFNVGFLHKDLSCQFASVTLPTQKSASPRKQKELVELLQKTMMKYLGKRKEPSKIIIPTNIKKNRNIRKLIKFR